MNIRKGIFFWSVVWLLPFVLAASVGASEKEVVQDSSEQKKPSPSSGFADLGATVKSIRFFESGYKQPPRSQRSYRTSFGAAKTRFINWQLDLDYPAPKRQIDFTVVAKCYKPDGEMKYEQSLQAKTAPDWRSSWHSMGWGNEEPGKVWQPGRYKIELLVDDHIIAKGYFNITEQEPVAEAPQAAVPAEGYESLGATVTSLKFYESGYKMPSKKDRVYRTSFDPATVRYLFWELNFKYPKPGRRVDFNITTNCYNPDDTVKFSQITESYIRPTWKTHWTTKGWGNKIPGKAWGPGRYRLEAEVNGEVIATGYFTMKAE